MKMKLSLLLNRALWSGYTDAALTLLTVTLVGHMVLVLAGCAGGPEPAPDGVDVLPTTTHIELSCPPCPANQPNCSCAFNGSGNHVGGTCNGKPLPVPVDYVLPIASSTSGDWPLGIYDDQGGDGCTTTGYVCWENMPGNWTTWTQHYVASDHQWHMKAGTGSVADTIGVECWHMLGDAFDRYGIQDAYAAAGTGTDTEKVVDRNGLDFNDATTVTAILSHSFAFGMPGNTNVGAVSTVTSGSYQAAAAWATSPSGASEAWIRVLSFSLPTNQSVSRGSQLGVGSDYGNTSQTLYSGTATTEWGYRAYWSLADGLSIAPSGANVVLSGNESDNGVGYAFH